MYTLRQIYDHPQEMIPVPESMRNHRVEVTFMALNADDELVDKQPLMGSYLLSFFKDVPPVQNANEELVIEPRSQQQDRKVDFE